MRRLHRLIDGEGVQLPASIWPSGQTAKDPHAREPHAANGELSDIQQAFIDEAAIQCGFCTPGFIMTLVEILETGKEYTTTPSSAKLLSGHLCRCTGYENIIRAVKNHV